MKHRHQSLVPLALVYVLILLCLGLAGPLRVARAYLQEAIQGSGKVVQETRPVSGFNAVVVSGIGEMSAGLGGSESLTIEAEDNIMPLIETEVKDDCLYIRFKHSTNINPTKPIRYSLTAKSLRRVGLSGVIKAQFSKLESDSFKLNVSGATQATFAALQGNELQAELSGASKVSISGAADSVKLNISGASRFTGVDFSCKTADVMASGASRADVQVRDSLNAKASGASAIHYKGSPNVTRNVSGVASVRAQD